MNQFDLSIITINWNNASGIKKTIESVIPQLTKNVQYIIVDGNSTDDSHEVIEKYKDSISIYIREPNKGIYGNMNRGIKDAKGEYCLFLNSGDLLNENILKPALEEINGQEDIIYFNTYLFYNYSHKEVLQFSSKLSMRNFYKDTINHQSVFIKTTLFSTLGMYNETNRIHSDSEFWIKSIIIGNCTYKHSDLILAYYDMNGRSSKVDKNLLIEIENIYLKFLPQRVLDDYEYWHHKEKEFVLFEWYKKQKPIFYIMKIFYKFICKITILKNYLKNSFIY